MADVEADDDAEAGSEQSQDDRDFLNEVLQEFDEDVLPQLEIRNLALQARRFVSVYGAQWDGEWGETWENAPKLEIDKVSAGLDKIERDYNSSRIEPDFRPAGGRGDQETADTLDGMYRADAYRFKAQQAMDNAFKEGTAGGFGAYRILNVKDDPYDPDNEHQRINPASIIVDADQRVFFDGNSKLYDKSDAERAHVLTAMTVGAFKREYKIDPPASWPDGVWQSQYDWFQPDVVLVNEYYRKVEVTEKLWIFTHETTAQVDKVWASDLDDEDRTEREARGWKGEQKRRKRCRVRKWTLCATQVLKDHGYIAGPHIPVIPFYGKRAFVDNVERFSGYVQKKMDSQRVYNTKVSKLAEIDALSPREMPIFMREQLPPDLQDLWARQVVDRHPYALVDPVTGPDGAPVAMGAISKIEPPQVPQVTALLLQAAQQDLMDDMADPDEVKANVSADAMDIAATRVDAKSGIFLDNWRQTVTRAGEVYQGMCGDVYVEELREVETMTEDGDDGIAVLMQPVTDEQGKFKIRNDFTAGRYKVIASVTEATATRRDKTVKSMLNTAQIAVTAQDMQLAQAAVLTAVMNQDGEGTTSLQEYARKRLVQMEVEKPNEEEKAEMEQAAQNQQPDPTQALIAAKTQESQATTQDKQASAQLKGAQAQETQASMIEKLASAQLKGAQAAAAGAPSDGPDGLSQMGQVIDMRHKLAQTQHLEEQTAAMPIEQQIEAHRAETQRLQAERKPISARGGEM